jgi:hypothetical protein
MKCVCGHDETDHDNDCLAHGKDGRFCNCKEFRETKKENSDMATTVPSNKKVKTKKKRKAKEPKSLLVVRFQATGKKHEKYNKETSKGFAALAYRAIVTDGPITFGEIWSKIYRSVTAGTEGKTPKNTVRAALSVLARDGYIKYIKAREAVKDVAA